MVVKFFSQKADKSLILVKETGSLVSIIPQINYNIIINAIVYKVMDVNINYDSGVISILIKQI